MSRDYTLSIHVELGAVKAVLLENEKKIKESTRTLHVREHLVNDFFKSIDSLLREVVENVIVKHAVNSAVVHVATPLTHAFSEVILFDSKKSIPLSQHVVHEIEQDTPSYIVRVLEEHARDGVYIQHTPHILRVRGYEVARDTKVGGPYEGVLYMQWITRVVYESVRVVLLPYNIQPTFVVEKENEYAVVHVGAYESQFFLPRNISAFPLAFGMRSLEYELADTYDVPLTHVRTVLRGQYNRHMREHPYISFVYKKIYEAVKNVATVLPVQMSHQPLLIQGSEELQTLIGRAFQDICGYVPRLRVKTNKK